MNKPDLSASGIEESNTEKGPNLISNKTKKMKTSVVL